MEIIQIRGIRGKNPLSASVVSILPFCPGDIAPGSAILKYIHHRGETMSTCNFWEGKRIRLRAYEPGDAETLWQWNQDSERARLLDFLWPPQSRARVQRQAEEGTQRGLDGDGYSWIIETLDGVPVGTLTTHNCSLRNGTFSYGVDIVSEQRGKGYAGEAIIIVLRYYFQELRYQKVTISAHADNAASIRLHEKLGYQHEGTLRRMQYTHGQYLDELFYGLTAEEFATKYP